MTHRGRLVMYLGTAATVIGLSKLHAIVHGYSWSGSSRFAWSLVVIGLFCLSAYAFGLPEQPATRRAAIMCSVLATFTAAAVVSCLQLFAGDALLPRFVVFGSVVVLIPWEVLCATMSRDVTTRASGRDRVLVVASADELGSLDDDLRHAAERPALLVCWLTPDECAAGVAPPARPLVDAVSERTATVVVLSRAAQARDDVVAQAALVHEQGVRVRTLSLFYEQWLGKLPIGELERVSLLFDINELHAAWYGRIKRLVDIGLGLLGLLVLVVITPVVVVGNLLGNRGPLFYRQARVGRHGSIIEMLKFRSMVTVAPTDADERTTLHDTRITRFGGILRATHLDELPQVVNILRGDLSVVGPRPEQPQVVERLTEKIPYYPLRHLVRPGLTGWAQVKYQYAGTDEETVEKLQYEFFYLRRQSLGLDLRIVGRTVRTVVGREGR